MSLVVAFTGRETAVMAGDLREMLMQGPDAGIRTFERELYQGSIMSDDSLMPVSYTHLTLPTNREV